MNKTTQVRSRRVSQRDKEKPANTSGRKTPVAFYRKIHPPAVEEYCRKHGRASFTELAGYLDVVDATVAQWYYNKPSFYDAYCRGVNLHMLDVAESKLDELIKGRRIVETTQRKRTTTRFDNDGNPRTVTETELIEKERQRDPDYKAIMQFLQSRFPNRWPSNEQMVDHRHLHKHEHEMKDNLKDMDEDELREAYKHITRITGERESESESDGGES